MRESLGRAFRDVNKLRGGRGASTLFLSALITRSPIASPAIGLYF